MALEQSLSELSLQVDEPSNIIAYAIKILNTAHPTQKVELTNRAVALWYAKKLSHSALTGAEIPDAPAQSEELEVIAPHKMKLGKGGSLQSRIAILHSLASIELHAINLAWDIIARFGHVTVGKEEPLPRDFFTDFVKVAEDECRHFSMLRNRLEELGSGFGKLPVHNGLWQSATETADDFLARLAVVHMVHEARGLDVTPNTIAKFRKHDDVVSADMLDTIYQEEITHVAAGMRWFRSAECCATFPPRWLDSGPICMTGIALQRTTSRMSPLLFFIARSSSISTELSSRRSMTRGEHRQASRQIGWSTIKRLPGLCFMSAIQVPTARGSRSSSGNLVAGLNTGGVMTSSEQSSARWPKLSLPLDLSAS
eukprot:TRINITY_DN11224_c0_g1_i3.p2 TRINITY_DN11224_c0_g1~~TRINITY_DN11224_c0_g1_i3.p2  ORF type:complete len:369 (+),score=19.41 TRINITY_DN11224_c0_g1_i3:1759-2865(+)